MVRCTVSSPAKDGLDHLAPKALPIAQGDDSARIQYLNGKLFDKIWLNYPAGDQVVQAIAKLFYAEKTHRPKSALLLAPSNHGKTMVLQRVRVLLRAQTVHDSEGATIPIVSIMSPGTPSEGGLYENILESIHALYSPGAKAVSKGNLVRDRLKEAGTRMVMIDEGEHVEHGDRVNVGRYLEAIKGLSADLRIPFVVAGCQKLFEPIRQIESVENRFWPHILHRWGDGEDVRGFLTDLARYLPLRHPSRLTDKPIIRFVLEKTNGIAGEISGLVRAAAIQAILTGRETVDLDLLSSVGYTGPLERRNMVEAFLLTERKYAPRA